MVPYRTPKLRAKPYVVPRLNRLKPKHYRPTTSAWIWIKYKRCFSRRTTQPGRSSRRAAGPIERTLRFTTGSFTHCWPITSKKRKRITNCRPNSTTDAHQPCTSLRGPLHIHVTLRCKSASRQPSPKHPAIRSKAARNALGDAHRGCGIRLVRPNM